MNKLNLNASIDEAEVAKFSSIADEWWDEGGKFKPLHRFNPVRIKYILDKVAELEIQNSGKNKSPNSNNQTPVTGLEILDIGCGGGLLSEPMARLGANVTSIDAGAQNIAVAKLHAQQEGLNINYIHCSAEELAKKRKKFDIVLNMEVIEHVADIDSFMKASCSLVKPDGVMFIATLNRTVKSYAMAIIGAEYILRWLPRGTHNWKKFLRPSEIEAQLSVNKLKLQEITGVTYNPLKGDFSLSKDIDVNYIMLARP